MLSGLRPKPRCRANRGEVAASRHSSTGRSTKHRQSSGRALTQQMGECRRRTQESDAAHDPSGAALCRDRSEQATQTDPETGPLYGRLQVRMHRFMRAVGPPGVFHGAGWLRGTPKSGASGSTHPK